MILLNTKGIIVDLYYKWGTRRTVLTHDLHPATADRLIMVRYSLGRSN